MKTKKIIKTHIKKLALLFFILFILSLSYITYSYLENKTKIEQIQTAFYIKEKEFNKSQMDLKSTIILLEGEKIALENILSEEQKEKLLLEEHKKENEKQIDELKKLTTIDPELIRKYSKVYFLNENYEPPVLKEVDNKFWINETKEIKILKEVEPFLDDLLKEASNENLDLKVLSGYRSFEEQINLKAGYSLTYGSGANQFSADQGYSEHQLGTTVDFTTSNILSASNSFENTDEFKWLKRNAHNYGFILSYPKGNEYYIYEPWHWRFVGIELASDLYSDKRDFYELSQREIDKYLIKIFDR